MTDKRKRQKLTRAQRVSRAERNERRGRDSKAAAWAKEHIVQPKRNPFAGLDLRTKRRKAEEAFAEALKEKIPAVEDAKGGS